MRFLSLIVGLLLTLNAHAGHDFIVYPEPLKAPASLFEDKYNNLQTLGHYQNKVVVLNFWATWCKPCLVEMPSLNKLAKMDKNLAILPIVGAQDNVSKVRSFYRRYKLYELGYFVDNQSFTAQSFQVVDVPTSFVFNKNGKLVAYASGAIDWMSPDNKAFLQGLLDQ
tara:strand:+ start:2158 stop:2658 length:501 start_codon:yes stop_codon:yes gene_type:complete